jgi:hypothetical protein
MLLKAFEKGLLALGVIGDVCGSSSCSWIWYCGGVCELPQMIPVSAVRQQLSKRAIVSVFGSLLYPPVSGGVGG